MKYHRLADIQRDITAGSLSLSDLVDSYLTRIEAGRALNLFVEVYAEEARNAARNVEAKLKAGKAGRLAGLVLGVKDVIAHCGHGLTASSRILAGFESQISATALERLMAEDAIIIGRQGCDEFAMGSSNENSVYGPARNPVDPDRVPGGSSGASAAAVAAGMCHASLGSDTGGSVRQPAAYCGVMGLKPSYGRISRWGLIAYASSFDQIGPITRSVDDAALLLQVMAGPDGRDQTAARHEVPDYAAALASSAAPRYTFGVMQEVMDSPGLDPEVKQALQSQIQQLQAAGHQVQTVHFPWLDYLVPCYYILTTAEASSNLSRYDGVRYGHRAGHPQDLEDLYVRTRSEGLGAEVQRRIMLGNFVLSAGYFDAYYTQAMKVRRLIRDQTRTLLESCDFLLMPTAPSPAFKIGEKNDDPIAMFLSDVFTVHANLAGVPAISLPLAQNSEGLPIGIQLMGKAFEEENLLKAAQAMYALPGSALH